MVRVIRSIVTVVITPWAVGEDTGREVDEDEEINKGISITHCVRVKVT